MALGTGCDLFEDCDPFTDPDCVNPDPDTSGSDTDTDTDPPDQFQSYFYVLVLDEEESGSNAFGTNGSEIDGVALVHGGTSNYADTVEAVGFGSGETDFRDQNQVLGLPEGSCDTEDGTFVSLGGSAGQTGGYLIVSFVNSATGDPQEIVEEDGIHVFGCSDSIEKYSVFVGVNPVRDDPHWHLCGEYLSGISECLLANLPEIPHE
jgi:hypothetical protein